MRIKGFASILALGLLSFNAAASIPLTMGSDGHFTIPAYVNNRGPFPFVLDTGADESGVYEWFADQTQLRKGKDQQLGGMTGITTAPTFKVAVLSVDGRIIRDFVADGYPNRHDAGRQAGVAGNDLMNGSIVVFDFPCKAVEIHSKLVDLRSVLTPGAVELHGGSVRDGTQLTFPVAVNGAEGLAVLDTGSRDTKINSRFASAARIDTSSKAFRDADLLYGADSHTLKSRKGPVRSFKFANMRLQNVNLRVADLPVLNSFGIGGGPAMILGIDIMSGYRLVYDHQRRRFWFGQSKCRLQSNI